MKEKFPRSSPLITQLMIRYIYKVRYAECSMNSIEEEEECNGIIMNVHINYIIMRSRSSISSRRMRYRADDAFDRDSEYISLQISTQQRDRKSDLSSPGLLELT